MYSVLNQSSLARSKTAFEREMPSKPKSRIRSESPSTSGVPSGGVQPSSARKLRYSQTQLYRTPHRQTTYCPTQGSQSATQPLHLRTFFAKPRRNLVCGKCLRIEVACLLPQPLSAASPTLLCCKNSDRPRRTRPA